MLHKLMMATAAVALAACATPLEVASVTKIASHTGSKGIDVHEPKRVQGQAGLPEFAGDQLLEVRSYSYKEGEGEIEFSGATCKLQAADYSAELTTPAKVRVPLYRNQSSSLSLACQNPGFKPHNSTVAAFDAVRHARFASGGNGGLIGVVATVAIDAMSDNTKNDWRYPVARVVMEPDAAGKPRRE